MWRIMWKEFRETALYALAAFVLVLLVLDYSAAGAGWDFIHVMSGLRQQPFSGYRTLSCIRGLDEQWGLLCIAIAGGIALWQLSSERLRHTWPLLIHLPITRVQIIFAKILAGLLMYLLLMGAVGAMVVARLLTPGVWYGPFYLRMAFPLLCTYLAGIVVYLAVFLAMLRPARWYSTKWLPALACAPSILTAFAVPAIWPAQLLPFERGSWENILVVCFVVVVNVLPVLLCLRGIRDEAQCREY
jgi:ABC-type transport system involved in multi-copper enzyme maturation permease subunit